MSMSKNKPSSGSAKLFKPAALPAAQEQLRAWLIMAGVDPAQDTAVGAGGAWVDAHLGRTARDHDINLYIAPERREQVLESLAAAADTHMWVKRDAVVFNLPGQIIADVKLLDKPQSAQQALREIDVGISALATDMFANQVWAAAEFTQDLAAKAIRLRPGMKSNAVNTAYLGKLGRKLPDFKITR